MSSPSPLSSFPPDIKEAHAAWITRHDQEALDRVIIAIVAYHRPGRGQPGHSEDMPDQARLMADLGFDSLALAEIVFFVEDLYKVTISNDDLKSIATVADLRAFVRTKVASQSAN
jgi:acyl carrier protein